MVCWFIYLIHNIIWKYNSLTAQFAFKILIYEHLNLQYNVQTFQLLSSISFLLFLIKFDIFLYHITPLFSLFPIKMKVYCQIINKICIYKRETFSTEKTQHKIWLSSTPINEIAEIPLELNTNQSNTPQTMYVLVLTVTGSLLILPHLLVLGSFLSTS